MTLAERIRKSRKAEKLTQQQLASSVGVARATVAQWENGTIQSLEGSNLLRAAQALHVSPDWLATGKGAMEPMLKEIQPPVTSRIPIVGTTQAGPDAHWGELGYPVGYGDEYVDMPRPDPSTYALRVRGGSMGNRIKDGEAIVVSPAIEPMPGEEVVVRTKDGQVMVKELAWRRAGEIALDSVGNGFGRIVIKETDLEWMHSVVGIVPSSRVKQR